MKHSAVIIILCLIYIFPSTVLSEKNDEVSAKEVLSKVFNKLSNLKTLNYTYQRELNYSSTGFQNKIQIESFLDFTSPDKIIGTKFQFDDPNSLTVFNGSEYFALNKNEKTIKIKSQPAFNDIENLSAFYDSPLTLRNALSKIISDENIPKKLSEVNINNKNYYNVEFILDSKILNLKGDYFPIKLQRKFIYRLTIEKDSYLPVSVFRGNSVNNDFSLTKFEYKDSNPTRPTETSWYYSSYLDDFKLAQPKENQLIKTGQTAPDWKLLSFTDDFPVSLSQYKNKVVLIEFWISFCGYCIAAVPKLNIINEKYKDKDFKLIAINAADKKEIIEVFKDNNKPNFQILYGGEETAKTYGTDGFPTIVLLDKNGKVIYSGVFKPSETEKLEELIDKNL